MPFFCASAFAHAHTHTHNLTLFKLVHFVFGGLAWQYFPALVSIYTLNGGKCLQDSDFVADKDDEGSPTDDSGADDSDGSDSGDEKEASVIIFFFVFVICDNSLLLSLWLC